MNRDKLIAAFRATAGQAPKKYEVEGWGTVYVKPLTVEQVDLQQQESKAEGKDPYRFARAAARVLCDSDGVLLFDAQSEDDLKLIAAQPWEKLKLIVVPDEGEAAKNG